MEVKSGNKFCPLDMLAEVASATLQNDPSLLINLPKQGSRINKVYKPQARKSVHSSEKLSLEQIKKLSEKSLIEMFSEPICDEMNRKYSFQCYLIPDQCSQLFKSFGNETRAKSKMKFHLLAHIRELTAAASGNHEPFMAEPLHVRRKRLLEMNRKSTRKKKQTKHLSNKLKKDHCEQFTKKYKGLKALKPDAQNPGKTIQNSKHNWPSRIEFDNINCGHKEYVDEMNNNNIGNKSQYLPYPSHNRVHESTDQAVLKGQSDMSDFNSAVPHGRVKRKPKSQNQVISKRKNSSAFKSSFIQESNSDYLENNANIYCDDQSELCLRIHHDHTYTSVNGKTFHDSSSGGDSKSSNKVYRDPFHPKKTSHRCLKRESPLIIPTPPFPYVYIPLLPHIALIQEVGSNVKTAGCKCKNNDITEGLDECNTNQKPASHSSTENKILEKAESQATSDNSVLDPKIDASSSSDAYMKGAISEDRSNNEASDIKPLFSENDVKPECPENLQAVEKKLALKCIRALRTKKKDERGPLTCQICKNKSFTAQATLMYHYRSHAGIKPFSCSVCEATFTRQHSLNYHMLIHNNKSRFVCTDCGRNFRHPSHYKEHLRRHTGETPYECTDCNLR